MQLELRRLRVASDYAEIERKEKVYGENIETFYMRKAFAVSSLILMKKQMPELVKNTELELQDLLNKLFVEGENALDIETRKKNGRM